MAYQIPGNTKYLFEIKNTQYKVFQLWKSLFCNYN